MGLFHDTCMAIVDLATGEAISGERLAAAEARLTVVQNGNPVRLTGDAAARALAAQGYGFCGNKVSKRARFCSKCGHGAPDGWFKCPQCGKWVGNDSKYCPHCNHPLFPEDRIDLAGGVWARKSDEFARLFDLGDVRFIKENGLMVQEGTMAILLDGGKEVAELGPGRHHPTGTLRSINWFGNPPPRSAIMVDSGECVFRVDFTGKNSGVGDVASAPLRSAEELEVGCVAEITLRFVRGRAAEFVANVMKEARSLSTKDVCALIYENALSAVRDLCTQSKIEDLVKDPERRVRFEDGITRALRDSMKSRGLEIVRTGAVEFYGAAYEEVRAKYGELEKRRRLVEFGKAQIEVFAAAADQDAAEGQRNARREQETEEYLAQLAQEKGLSEIERTQELAIAKRVSAGEISAAEAKLAAARELEEHAKDMSALAHKLELDLTLRNYDREQLVADAENKARLAAKARAERVAEAQTDVAVAEERLKQRKIAVVAERADIDTEIYKARQGQELLREMKEIKTADMKAKLDAIRGATVTELAFVSDDPELRAQLLQQELAKAQLAAEQAKAAVEAGLSAEQLLARAAATSSSAADALAKMRGVGAEAAERVLEEMKRMEAERRAHDEAQLKRTAELAEKAIQHQNTTIVPPAATTVVR